MRPGHLLLLLAYIFGGVWLGRVACADDRLAVPPSAEITKAAQSVRQAFRDSLSKTKPEELLAVGANLVEVASGEKDPVVRYALLIEAENVMAKADNLQSVLSVVERRVKEYRLEPLQEQAAAITSLGRSTREAKTHAQIVTYCGGLIESFVAQENFEAADRWMRLAEPSASRAKDPAVTRQLADLRSSIVAARRELTLFQNASTRLLEKPDDPDANLAIGKFYCLNKSDWEKGLPYLGKGRDAALADLARRDGMNPADAAQQASLAGAWWDFAEKQPAAQRPAFKRRAVRWYEAALPSLQGLAKRAAEQRIAEVASTTTDNGAAMARTVDVLAKVDLAKHVASGRWSQDKGSVTVQPDNNARLILPIAPKSVEYDLLFEFTRHSGNQGFGLHLCVGDRTFLLQMSAVDNQFLGLNDFKDPPQQPSTIRWSVPGDGKKHAMLVRIRKKGIQIDFDGKSLFSYATDYTNVITKDWGFGGNTLGLISWYNVVTFHKIEMKEIRGK